MSPRKIHARPKRSTGSPPRKFNRRDVIESVKAGKWMGIITVLSGVGEEIRSYLPSLFSMVPFQLFALIALIAFALLFLKSFVSHWRSDNTGQE